ncbi:hypothetical protein GPECTOR_20g585 [Gonium pectorale]|uniref:Ankyrin repeat domain-containing protein n=1 Tax=Gonium pectorale TaxID=33097 RepID=A0A150GIS9_GONPE|nr:hypothetical protein GPECTOR_20g585 [Gonium pectorale]|eukprot:KXZ49728.1 hypothetical protein GPECTOR_20g585 [Gonium pectorale]
MASAFEPLERYKAALEAARGGHMELARWLLQPLEDFSPRVLQLQAVAAAAEGCDLAALQHRVRTGGWAQRWGDEGVSKDCALGVAACSLTPDWTAKVEWLEAQGCHRSSYTTMVAAQRPDAVTRVAWMRDRGYPVDRLAVEVVAASGNMAALQYLLAEVPPAAGSSAGAAASGGGHLAALQALHGAGWEVGARGAGLAAARGGHAHVLAWLVEALGTEAVVLDAELFAAAAESGSVGLLVELRERGCPWDARALAGVARSGCEAALEWLVERGCPMEASQDAYIAACRNADLATLCCLRRLGVPWGSFGEVSWSALPQPQPPLLRWLRQEGCPLGRNWALRAQRQDYDFGHPLSADEALAVMAWHSRQRRLWLQRMGLWGKALGFVLDIPYLFYSRWGPRVDAEQ